MAPCTARVGTSGWSYDHWQGILYPHGASSAARLRHYIGRYDTVEVNSSYYRWPRDETFAGWRQKVPEGFRFSVKAPRPLAHMWRLSAPDRWFERIEGGLGRLGDRLGVFLVQLPAHFRYDPARLSGFLRRMPERFPLALEFRDPSWNREDVFVALESRGAAYCVMSGAGLPCVLRATAPFVYVRLHGPDPHHLYGGSYSEDDLRWWAERIREWEAQRRTVWAYFNNDWEGNAVRNADTLKRLLGLQA
jgi:uncharacterized protein YecE (DUF72 family)